MVVRRRHEDVTGEEPLALGRGTGRQSTVPGEDRRQRTRRPGRHVQHDEDGRRQVVRQSPDEVGERLDAARRGAHDDDVPDGRGLRHGS